MLPGPSGFALERREIVARLQAASRTASDSRERDRRSPARREPTACGIDPRAEAKFPTLTASRDPERDIRAVSLPRRKAFETHINMQARLLSALISLFLATAVTRA